MVELTWTMSIDSAEDAADETKLIAASLSGDPNAFGQLVRLHQHRVFRLVGRFFRQRDDVEDVAQETFLTAWRKLGTYKAKAPFEHWLTRVCLNCCYGALRKSKPVVPLGDKAEPASETHDPDAGVEVERLLARLKPVDRFVLLMLDGEGWSTAEIAERLGWSATNVKVRAHRARKRLRALVEST